MQQQPEPLRYYVNVGGAWLYFNLLIVDHMTEVFLPRFLPLNFSSLGLKIYM